MKLTKKTDFVLRTLIYLAKQPKGKRIFLQEIAQAYDIPINHLTKIVNQLGQLGYIKTYRGKNGGIELGKSKEDIVIKQVIIDFEPTLAPADCENCLLASNECKLQGLLAEASTAFLNTLGDKKLSDLI